MADLSITAASVVSGASAKVDRSGFAGETVTAGKTGYRDPATRKWMLADSNSATVAARAPKGIFLNGAALNQPVAVHEEGLITIGATLTPGVAYYQSDTAGGICPVADVGSGEYSTIVGIARSATVLDVSFKSSDVAL